MQSEKPQRENVLVEKAMKANATPQHSWMGSILKQEIYPDIPCHPPPTHTICELHTVRNTATLNNYVTKRRSISW